MEFFTVCSLEKVFKTIKPSFIETDGLMFRNEVYNFQAVFSDGKELKDISVQAPSGTFDVTARYVADLRADLENKDIHDDYVLSSPDKMYPEVLAKEIPDTLRKGKLHSLWIQARAKESAAAGGHIIPINLYSGGKLLAQTGYNLELIDGNLPETDIPVTCWIHYDCIAHRHNVALFERDFYKVFEKYLALYTGGGHNMLLIPTFTPALDTAVGGERRTAQLVGVERKGGEYSFDFDKLDKFIDFVKARGIKYFEFAHLFTQWGAKACPKIIAKTENGISERIFGWETDSSGDAYKGFLSRYLPALTQYVTRKGIAGKSFFHLSDEPSAEHIDRYEELYGFVKQFTAIKTMDALSSFDFYKRGIVDAPAVASDRALPFLENSARHFVYYCVTQRGGYVANRFFAMPSERNAVLGIQLYQNGSLGFLHWGFNFYNTRYSLKEIDPYAYTSSGGEFPSGDAFIVYPDGNGAAASLRLEVFHEGIQLYRALKKLESLIGRERVLQILVSRGFKNYDTYPRSPEALKALKKEIYGFFH